MEIMQLSGSITEFISVELNDPLRWPMEINYVTKRRLFRWGTVFRKYPLRSISSDEQLGLGASSIARSRGRVQRENYLEYLERNNEAKR